jgi:hypothetical protein
VKKFFPYLLMAALVLIFSNSSWGQFPCNPGDSVDICCGADSGYLGYSRDLGICDTLYVVPWSETDTCFIVGSDTICINNPGENFPCFLHVPLLVTHDSNTFYWEYGNKWVQDSITGFVVPLAWSRTNPTVYCSLSAYWNENVMTPYDPRFPRSVWRHFHPSELDSNRMAWLASQGLEWLAILNVTSDSSWYYYGGDSLFAPPHMWMALLVTEETDRRWWEGDRTLLATLTFRIADSMHICIDSTWWPPASNLGFIRYDAKRYFPRDNLPLCIWGGPPILVTSPNGGEAWGIGETHNITWLSENFTGANVKIEFSTNGGTSWMPIIASTPNDGVHPWLIPNNPSNQCKVRVSDAEDGVPYDISDNNFAIISIGITVTSPNGGENWCAGSTQLITWSATGVTDLSIEYSINGGVDWNIIAFSTPNDGEYSWDIPPHLATSTTCRVKISDFDGDPSDMSDADFTITGKSVAVISPNGGETWVVDSTYNITWTDSCVANVSIEYSTNDGVDWNTIISDTPSDGSYSWQVPDTPSDYCRVRICDTSGSPCDTSDNDFTIIVPSITVTSPNGGENWCRGSSQLITWTAQYISEVKIEYSTTGGPPWETIVASTPSDGEYSWDIPPDSSFSATCKVKISDLDGDPSDESDSNFTIFLAGDVDSSGEVNIGDAIYLINYLFMSGSPPIPFESGDVNSDGGVDIGDVIYLVTYLFSSGPPPLC